MKKRFRTAYNSEPEKGEVNNMPSETIPDQSMSVGEIVKRYARGLPLDGARVPVWMDREEPDDLDLLDWNKLDLAEKQEIRERYQQELDELKENLKDIRKRYQQVPKEEKETPMENQKPSAGATQEDQKK